jgi:hypothetical protein
MDPTKRFVARALDARWNGALEKLSRASAGLKTCAPVAARPRSIARR